MTIDRRENLSYLEFERDFLKPLRPLIVTDAIRGWPALGKWTPEFFRDYYGTLPICVDGRSMTLGEMIELVLTSSPAQPAPYLRNQLLSKWPHELRADVTPLPT